MKVAAEGVRRFREENYEIIIVDTSGRHRQEAELFKEMKEIETAVVRSPPPLLPYTRKREARYVVVGLGLFFLLLMLR